MTWGERRLRAERRMLLTRYDFYIKEKQPSIRSRLSNTWQWGDDVRGENNS
jgi:hypothetical protein